jgi:hypothetical protein
MTPESIRNAIVELMQDEPRKNCEGLIRLLDREAASERNAPLLRLLEDVLFDENPSHDIGARKIVLSLINTTCGKRASLRDLRSRLEMHGPVPVYERCLQSASVVRKTRALREKVATANEELKRRTCEIGRQVCEDVSALEKLNRELRQSEKEAWEGLRQIDREEARAIGSGRWRTGLGAWVRRVRGLGTCGPVPDR